MEENYGNDNNQWENTPNTDQNAGQGNNQWDANQNTNQGNTQWDANQNTNQGNTQWNANPSTPRAGDEFQQGPNQFTQAPQEGYYVPEEPNPGLSVAGMVCGILSIVLCCCSKYLTLVLAVAGLSLSAYALAKDKPGKGMAIAGLICSIIGLAISLLMVIASLFSTTYMNNIFDKYHQDINNLDI